ncbi:MAG: Xaa-Pro peptidase family protein [Geobacteraceae bacterium]|jgi:Xaa-Pro aminopeptidase
MLNNRISSARRYLERFGVEAIIFLGLPNIRYLTGFTGSDGALVLAKDKGWFLTDSRYTTQASLEVTGYGVVEYRIKTEGIAALLNAEKVKKIGFEAEQTTVSFLRAVTEALPEVEWLPVGIELDDLRIIKSADELQLLAESAAIASQALIGVLDSIRAGVPERDIALALEFAMKRAGADEKSFDFIVASGPRGALPHGKASDKLIQAGELVTIDFGAVYRGYHSDETVTVAVGVPDSRQKEIYSIVKDAHDKALEAVKPGISLRELDDIARGFIDGKGFANFFGHGLGHGVGLEVHEKPTVSFRSEQVAAEGMVFTIEPGIYIPDWGGVRIEDTVVVTQDGCRTLTKVPKQLMVL